MHISYTTEFHQDLVISADSTKINSFAPLSNVCICARSHETYNFVKASLTDLLLFSRSI